MTQRQSVHLTQQLLLQYVLALLVLLTTLECSIVLPAYHLSTLLASDVSHYVFASSHIALSGFALLDVDNGVE